MQSCCSAKALSLAQIPQIIELPSNHNKGYWPGNHWLRSQHGKHWDHSMLWKQDLLLWLHTSEWVPFKGTKVPSFSIRAGLVTRASFSSGPSPSSLRVWLRGKLFLIGQLLLISSTNNDEAEKHKALFVISLTRTGRMCSDCNLPWEGGRGKFECHCKLADSHVLV